MPKPKPIYDEQTEHDLGNLAKSPRKQRTWRTLWIKSEIEFFTAVITLVAAILALFPNDKGQPQVCNVMIGICGDGWTIYSAQSTPIPLDSCPDSTLRDGFNEPCSHDEDYDEVHDDYDECPSVGDRGAGVNSKGCPKETPTPIISTLTSTASYTLAPTNTIAFTPTWTNTATLTPTLTNTITYTPTLTTTLTSTTTDTPTKNFNATATQEQFQTSEARVRNITETAEAWTPTLTTTNVVAPVSSIICNPGQWDSCGSHDCNYDQSAQCNSEGTGWLCHDDPATCIKTASSGGSGGSSTPCYDNAFYEGLKANFFAEPAPAKYDLNGDNKIDLLDYSIMSTYYNPDGCP